MATRGLRGREIAHTPKKGLDAFVFRTTGGASSIAAAIRTRVTPKGVDQMPSGIDPMIRPIKFDLSQTPALTEPPTTIYDAMARLKLAQARIATVTDRLTLARAEHSKLTEPPSALQRLLFWRTAKRKELADTAGRKVGEAETE